MKTDDRVDILVGWKVPVSSDVHFVSSTKIQNSWVEGNANFAKARFAAKMLLDNNHIFDGALHCPLDTAGLLFRWLIGNSDNAFKKASSSIDHYICASKAEFFTAGLTVLSQGDVSLAAICTAHIGSLREIAEQLASSINNHFKIKLTGCEIESVSQ
jgi:hypothetical protein